MISKRSMFLAAVVLIVAAVVVSDFFARRAGCGSGGQQKTTGAVVALRQHARGGPCGQSVSTPAGQELEVGVLFLTALAAGASVMGDLRAWRNAGMGD